MFPLVSPCGHSPSQVQRRASVQLQTLWKLARHFRSHLSPGRKRRSEIRETKSVDQCEHLMPRWWGWFCAITCEQRTRPPSSCQLVSDWRARRKQALRMGEESFTIGSRQNKWSLCSLRLQPLFTPIPQHTPLPTPCTTGREIPRPREPERMYFRIPQESGPVSSTVLSSLRFRILSHPPPSSMTKM